MSVQAITWVLEEAPDLPVHLVSTLLALANHADRNGRGSYPSQDLIAWYTRKTDRAIRKDLKQLLDAGLIRRGDQRLVAHIAADERPIVYELAVERKRPRRDIDTPRDRNSSSARSTRGTGTPVPTQQAKGQEPQFRPNHRTDRNSSSARTAEGPELQFQRDRNCGSEGTGTPVPTNRPGTVLEPLSQRGGAHALVAAALGTNERETELTLELIRTENPNIRSEMAFLRTLTGNGDLANYHRRAVAAAQPGPAKPQPHDYVDPNNTGRCQHPGCGRPEPVLVHRHLRAAGA